MSISLYSFSQYVLRPNRYIYKVLTGLYAALLAIKIHTLIVENDSIVIVVMKLNVLVNSLYKCPAIVILHSCVFALGPDTSECSFLFNVLICVFCILCNIVMIHSVKLYLACRWCCNLASQYCVTTYNQLRSPVFLISFSLKVILSLHLWHGRGLLSIPHPTSFSLCSRQSMCADPSKTTMFLLLIRNKGGNN